MSIPATDEGFVYWREEHGLGLGARDAMSAYVQHLNFEGKDSTMSKWNSIKRTCEQSFPRNSGRKLMVSGWRQMNIKLWTVHLAKPLSFILHPGNTPQNIFSLQITPNSQNMSSLPEQSLPQNNSSPPLSEQPPSQIIPPPSDEQRTDPAKAERASSPGIIDANSLTMQQAVELFELLQARKVKEAEKSVTVEAQPVAGAPASVRAEPLSFLTLGTVEGIVGSTSPDALQEQTSWQGKVEKYMRLSHIYSSDNTISGEKCYMVDEALYKDILLAVAARKQNESTLSSASEKLEQHKSQIEDSPNRVIQREKEVIDQFAAGITVSQAKIRMGHSARMKAVMADILALKDSITASSEHDKNNQEMQQLKFQVAQYEGILPVYQSRLKDTEELNKKLGDERTEELTKNIERLKEKLDRAESLVLSMGIPEAIRQRGPAVIGTSTEHSSSSSQDDSKVGAPKGTEQNPVEHVDLRISPTDSAGVTMAASAAPVIKFSFKKVIESVHKQNKANKNMEGSAGIWTAPTVKIDQPLHSQP
jgi:hypothetical protein